MTNALKELLVFGCSFLFSHPGHSDHSKAKNPAVMMAKEASGSGQDQVAKGGGPEKNGVKKKSGGGRSATPKTRGGAGGAKKKKA